MKLPIVAIILLFTSNLKASTFNGFEAQLYGFIKASANYTDQAVGSFNNINLSAPTHAVAHTKSSDETSRLSFQTAMSRVGLNLKKAENLSAKLEFDFIDFSKSSPTTQMNPRVRIAAVTYSWGDQKVVIGQDWDLFSPVTSVTFDYVGLYFYAGNTGFMRQQAQYLKSLGDWELGAALGMAGNNPSVSDGNLEENKAPSYAARITRKLPGGRVGVSAIYAKIDYEQAGQNGSSHDSYAANTFYEQTLKAMTIKSEFYYGQNLNNIGALAIGRGNQNQDVKEFGGTLTATYSILDHHALFGGVGFAKVDNSSEIPPFSPNPNTGAVIVDPGLASNFLTRIGWEYKVTEDLSWITELSRFETKSKLGDNQYQLNIAYGVDSGVQLRF